MDLNTRIKALKPALAMNSVQTYASLLRNLWKQLGFEECISRTSIGKHHQHITDYIESTYIEQPKKAKQLYSAMLVFNEPDLHEPLECFQTMKNLIHAHNQNDMISEEKQELTSAQKKAYLSWNDIIAVRDRLKTEVEPLWHSDNLNHIKKVQDYVIACVYTMIPPRRLLDYTIMSKYPPVGLRDNGLLRKNGKMYFVFSHYKTSACYGQQIIEIPPILEDVLAKWTELNSSPHLFFYKSFATPFTVKQLQRTLAAIFNKPGFGFNILRHAYVSDQVLPDMPFIDELKSIASQMGHSTQQQVLYKKHN
jgi:hypothetical protein